MKFVITCLISIIICMGCFYIGLVVGSHLNDAPIKRDFTVKDSAVCVLCPDTSSLATQYFKNTYHAKLDSITIMYNPDSSHQILFNLPRAGDVRAFRMLHDTTLYYQFYNGHEWLFLNQQK